MELTEDEYLAFRKTIDANRPKADEKDSLAALVITSDVLINSANKIATYSADTLCLIELILRHTQLKTSIAVYIDNLVFVADFRTEVTDTEQIILITVTQPAYCSFTITRTLNLLTRRITWFVADNLDWTRTGASYWQDFTPLVSTSDNTFGDVLTAPKVNMDGLETPDKPTRLVSTKPTIVPRGAKYSGLDPGQSKPIPPEVTKVTEESPLEDLPSVKQECKRRKVTI
jgi:hypothetical protein